MLKLKLQYFGHLVQRADSLKKTLMLGKIEGGQKKGPQRVRWLDGITNQWTWVWANSRSWWWTGRPGILQSIGSQRVGHNWVTELNWSTEYCCFHMMPVLLSSPIWAQTHICSFYLINTSPGDVCVCVRIWKIGLISDYLTQYKVNRRNYDNTKGKRQLSWSNLFYLWHWCMLHLLPNNEKHLN